MRNGASRRFGEGGHDAGVAKHVAGGSHRRVSPLLPADWADAGVLGDLQASLSPRKRPWRRWNWLQRRRMLWVEGILRTR